MFSRKMIFFFRFFFTNKQYFRCTQTELVLAVVSWSKSDSVKDLLLLSDGTTYHYVSIKELEKVVDIIRHGDPRPGNDICRY